MKRIILSMLSFVMLASANAQISKGQKMIGGELSFTSNDGNNTNFFGPTKTVTITIAPQIGFGLQKNWVVGGGAGYGHQSQKVGSSNTYSKIAANIFTVTLFVRKFHPFNERAGIYGQLDAGTGFGKSKEKQVQNNISQITNEADVSNITAIIRPGFYFKATKRIIIEANFGGITYTSSTYKPKNDIKTTSKEFSFTLTSSIGLGFQVIF